MKRVVVALAIVAFAALAVPAHAQDVKFKLYTGVAYLAPLADDDFTIAGLTETIQASNEPGWNAGFEWRMSKLLGFEVDYVYAKHDVEFAGATIGDVRLQPLSATLNFHLVRTENFDLYLGPTGSYVTWGDINLNQAGQSAAGISGIPTETDTTYGASFGFDIGLGKNFAFMFGVKYLVLNVTPDGGEGLSVDPLVSRLAMGFRW